MFTVGISRASHLLLICTGAPDFYDLLATIDLVATLSRREGWDRILVDCVSVPRTFTPEELVVIGEYAGMTLAGTHVALVVPDEKRFDVIRPPTDSAGANLQFFKSNLDAANWLMAASEHPAEVDLHVPH